MTAPKIFEDGHCVAFVFSKIKTLNSQNHSSHGLLSRWFTLLVTKPWIHSTWLISFLTEAVFQVKFNQSRIEWFYYFPWSAHYPSIDAAYKFSSLPPFPHHTGAWCLDCGLRRPLESFWMCCCLWIWISSLNVCARESILRFFCSSNWDCGTGGT